MRIAFLFYSFCFSFLFFFVVARFSALIMMKFFLKEEQVLSLCVCIFFVKLIYWWGSSRRRRCCCYYYWCFFLLLYERVFFSCPVYVFSCNLKQKNIQRRKTRKEAHRSEQIIIDNWIYSCKIAWLTETDCNIYRGKSRLSSFFL